MCSNGVAFTEASSALMCLVSTARALLGPGVAAMADGSAGCCVLTQPPLQGQLCALLGTCNPSSHWRGPGAVISSL